MATVLTRPRLLLIRLALQNLGRRKARTTLLMAAVAIASAIVFTGAVLMASIRTSMATGFSRLGADIMVVPADTLTNITDALLTVEPTDQTLDAGLLDRTHMAGLGRIAPQRVFRTDQSGFGGHAQTVDLIGFEPERDFTVLPWLSERLDRTMQSGDVVVGAAHDLPLGSEIILFGKAFRIYGKLARTGVGTHERGIFMRSVDLISIAPTIRAHTNATPRMLDPARTSGFLIELAQGATELQVRFALLSRLTDIKVITGRAVLTGIRQGLAALLDGSLALVALMFGSTALVVGVLFSAIITERRSELGLLKAIGARRRQIVGMILTEAMIATGAGGIVGVLFGILLLRLFERSLIFHLTQIGIPFVWLDASSRLAIAIACVIAAALVGAGGAIAPAWRTTRRDAYDLIRGEG